MKRTCTRHATVLMATLLILVAGALPASAQDDQRWINVHVVESGEGNEVEVHLPLNLILAVIEGVDTEGFSRGKVEIDLDDVDIDWPQILTAMQDAPDGEFVTVTSTDADVTMRKAAGLLQVHVTEKGGDNAVVDMTLPVSMIGALEVDEQNRVDVAALLRSLDELPDGELLRVQADEAQVRVWVE